MLICRYEDDFNLGTPFAEVLTRADAGRRRECVAHLSRTQARQYVFPLKSQNGIKANDPLCRFHRLADKGAKSLTDRENDRLVYGG